MASPLDKQINARVESFVADITRMARQAAFVILRQALGDDGRRAGNGVAGRERRRRRGGKRAPAELARVQKQLAEFVASNPGSRMEQIGKALGYRTAELVLPMRKLIAAKQIKTRGHKRSRRYFPAGR